MAKQREEEDDDNTTEDSYQAEDFDMVDEDGTQTTTAITASAFSVSLNYKTLLYILIAVSGSSLATTAYLSYLLSKRLDRVERHVERLAFDYGNGNGNGNGKPTITENLCPSCMSKKEKGAQTMDEWVAMLQGKIKEDAANQNVPSRNQVYQMPEMSINEIYKVKRNLSGEIVGVSKQNSYVR